ncbi:hypothetical protein RRG08_033587 [Elysia crispata]|uniref:Uncharacterized protein n=1 Tax=Elysia crispata TaxID=231223 RepID=A0AAE1CK20_9GAST|nr:hypothetical protein RRG08_033587 [Elysia crispata]
MRQGFGHTRHAFRVHSHLGAMTRRTKDANERNASSIGDPQGQTLWLEGTMDSAQDKQGLTNEVSRTKCLYERILLSSTFSNRGSVLVKMSKKMLATGLGQIECALSINEERQWI